MLFFVRKEVSNDGSADDGADDDIQSRGQRCKCGDKIKKTVAIAGGSIGKAIAYIDGQAVEFYDSIYALATSGRNFKTADMLKFCDMVAETEESYELFKELVLKFLSEQARAQNKIEESSDMFDKATHIFLETEALNLDKRLAVMNIMTGICKIY